MAKASTAIAPGSEARVVEGLLRQNAHRHDLWACWSDWVEMQALAISNACDMPQYDQREARYLEIVKRYDSAEMQRFSHAAGLVQLALERNPWQDFLGSLFMTMELGNKWAGQFFTPYCVTSVLARMSLHDEQDVPECGFWTVSDPCIGGGAMAIGACEAMAARFEDWNWKLHITGQDIDIKAVHMAYVQLSWIGAPAQIIHGNTLAFEQRSIWYTPGHVFGGWTWKLRRRSGDRNRAEVVPAEPPTQSQPVQQRTVQKTQRKLEFAQ